MNHSVLIVEDDPDIGALLRLHASLCADDVRLESNGRRGLLVAQARHWDLVVLDWLLPGTDGVSICRQLRANQYRQPILLLTARTSESDRVTGLDAGADDYVAKPFSIAEFKARLRAQLRRSDQLRSASARAPGDEPIQAGPMRIDPAARNLTLGGIALALTGREFDLLVHFARNPGRVFTREQLLADVWGAGFDGYDHTVNSHINRLRAKIERDPTRPRRIVTVWGHGYRFEPALDA